MKRQWRYAAVGNVVKNRIDENGILRHGTKEFPAGAKLYLFGKYWDKSFEDISVIGFDRHKRYRVVDLSYEYIENLRIQRVYKPKVLEIMNSFEFEHVWWSNTEEDIKNIQDFLIRWNNKKTTIN